MPLQRLTPLIKRQDLGYLRLWQDELAEIARLVGQLPGVEVRMEADNNLLTDVRADLPQLGQRVSYFTVTATRPGEGQSQPQDVISVKLTPERCLIEATEPDLTTMGLIESIKSLAASCRRMPQQLLPLYRTQVNVGTSVVSTEASLAGAFIIVGLISGAIFGIGVVQHLLHPHGRPDVAWPLSVSVAIPVVLLVIGLGLGLVRARTLLFTATREDAPTFLQRKGPDIVINVAVGLVFFLLGLLIAHL